MNGSAAFRVGSSALVGGLIREANGGDFIKGATASAIQTICNDLMHENDGGKVKEEMSPWRRRALAMGVQKEVGEITEDANSNSIGQPGTWESLIPVWGSGRAAVEHFQNGNYLRGVGYSVLAISDVFLVKSIATALGRGAWKFGSHSWSATRAWLRSRGYAGAGQPVHHWAITQATGRRYGIQSFINQPWNLKTFANQSIHMRAGHGYNYLGQPGFGKIGQLWFGTPVWPKAITGSYGGRILFGIFD